MFIYTKKLNSDVNPLIKYWWLKKALADTIFGHNLRTRFFPGMQFLENIKGPDLLSFYIISIQN